MTTANIVLLIANLIIFIWLGKAAYRIVSQNHGKFSTFAPSINYWGSRLKSGDKFIFFPNKNKDNHSSNEFMQFKVFVKGEVHHVDLVYPLTQKTPDYETHKREFLALAKFFNMNLVCLIDENNCIDFYFVEVDYACDGHNLFLAAVAIQFRGFSFGGDYSIDLIKGGKKSSHERFTVTA